jgi:mannose-6-phosphate isomerase class I
VHALGNPEGRGLLALEIRRPGVTYRAWDHVRFPLREIDVDATISALSFEATRPEEFLVAPRPVRPGVQRSVDCEFFRLEHLTPASGMSVEVARTAPHTLHALAGRVTLLRADGSELGSLERGESALVPAQVGDYRIDAVEEPVLLVKVELPPYAD